MLNVPDRSHKFPSRQAVVLFVLGAILGWRLTAYVLEREHESAVFDELVKNHGCVVVDTSKETRYLVDRMCEYADGRAFMEHR